MASPYSTWADSLSYHHPYLSQSASVSDNSSLPSAAQPFTTSKNVSYSRPEPAQETLHHDMAKKRRPSQHRGPAPAAGAVAGAGAVRSAHDMKDFACSAIIPAEHCHISPPCDKPDCDEATICFDHDAHDFFPCNNDLSWWQEHSKCDVNFACAGDACDLDFDCNLFSCPETCHQAQHAQGCNTACATVACSDPQCDEGVLYCCLSDVCPHKTHVDCHPPCPQDCEQAHTHCVAPLAVPCHPPCNVSSNSSSTLSLPDTVSTSTISTPQTDPSDSLQTPTNLHFQSLVEAATAQASLAIPGSDAWDMSSQYDW